MDINEMLEMQAGNSNCSENLPKNLPLAYAYVPMQVLCKVYDYSDALKNGTVFPSLNKPLGVYGEEFKVCDDNCHYDENTPNCCSIKEADRR